MNNTITGFLYGLAAPFVLGAFFAAILIIVRG